MVIECKIHGKDLFQSSHTYSIIFQHTCSQFYIATTGNLSRNSMPLLEAFLLGIDNFVTFSIITDDRPFTCNGRDMISMVDIQFTSSQQFKKHERKLAALTFFQTFLKYSLKLF